jgi:hypothetical protein
VSDRYDDRQRFDHLNGARQEDRRHQDELRRRSRHEEHETILVEWTYRPCVTVR